MDTGAAACRPRPRLRRSLASAVLLATMLIAWRPAAIARAATIPFNSTGLPSELVPDPANRHGTSNIRPAHVILMTRQQFDVRPLLGALSNLPAPVQLADTTGRATRWEMGRRTAAMGWLQILSDITIWLAYLIIPLSLLYFANRQGNPPFASLFWLFSGLLICNGAAHLMEAIAFWWPAYGLETALKLLTAAMSVVTLVAFIYHMPQAIKLRNPELLEAEIKQRLRELAASRTRTALITETSPAGVIMTDEQGTIIEFNPAAEVMFQHERASVLGREVEILLPERYRAKHQPLREKYVSFPQIRNMGTGRDLWALRCDGSEFPVEIGLSPVVTDEGLFVLCSVVDITERKSMEANLEQQSKELAETNKALLRSNEDLQQFAYVASHDLQEPLRKISSYCQLLREEHGESLSEEANAYLDVVVDGAQRLKRLVQDLLSFSRISTRGRGISAVEANACLQAALENLEFAINENDAQITCDPLPTVLADESQLILLFQNLVGNAIKFRGESIPKIHIGSREMGKQCEVFVRDNGIGIEPQYWERIFDIFERLHNRREYSGTGIGLALCRRIVERFGGTIRVESEPGDGCTFTFTMYTAEMAGGLHDSNSQLAAVGASH